MKILRMKLENFQGVKEFEIAPNGHSCAVYGDNATGKSTLYNAFTWLMYGKPSTGEKNYTPKTTGSHHLNHAAEMEAEAGNGVVVRLRKDFHEVYKTVRGSAQEVFAGHTTDYSIDGVPVSESQFKKMLATLYRDEELAKMLTLYNYFCETMKVSDRRKILLEVCGGVGLDDVIASDPELAALPELMQKPGNTDARYTVEEYQAIAAKERIRIDRELKAIPLQINEAERAKPDVKGLSEEGIRSQIGKLRQERNSLESDRAAGESAAETAIKGQIAELERQQAVSEAAHIRAESDKNKSTHASINSLMARKTEVYLSAAQAERDARMHRSEAERLRAMRERLMDEWTTEDAKEWSGSETCPTCGQTLPAEQIAAARETFNIAKAKRLEEINQRGSKECSMDMIEKEKAEASRLENAAKDGREKLSGLEARIDDLQASLVMETPYRDTDEGRAYEQQIAELEGKLSDIRSAAREADTELNRRIKEADRGIEELEQKLAQITLAEKQDERIAELGKQEKELAVQYERVQYGLHLCELYTRTQAGLLDEKINSRFKTLQFRLFITQQNGGIADDCEALIPCENGLVPFKSANNAARINAGLEVIDTLAAHYGVQMPVFVDNAESVTRIQHTDTQVVRLVVSEPDKVLRFEEEI